MTDSDIHISLRDYVDVRVAALEAKVEAVRDQITLALASSEKAVTKSEVASDRRFESVNEFRTVLADQSATLLPRSEYAVQHMALSNRIDSIDRALIEHKADTIKTSASPPGGPAAWASS